MYDMDNALISGDIKKIVNGVNSKLNNFEYKVHIHTPETDLAIDQLQTVEFMRNYNDNVGDHVVVTMNVPAGKFIKKIYPFRDVLELTLIKSYDAGAFPDTQVRYKMIMTNNTGAIDGSRYSNTSEEDLDLKEIFTVQAQCIERELLGIMNQPVVGFNFKETPKKLIPGIILTSLKETKVEGKPIKFKFDMTDPDNKEQIEFTVPSGTTAIEIPTMLQMIENGGVYNHGLGCYFQSYAKTNAEQPQPTLWVYPQFSPHRFYNVNYTGGMRALFFFTGTAKYDNVENTFIIDGDCINIIADSQSTAIDKGETEHVNSGDSIIIPSQRGMIERNAVVDKKSVAVDTEASTSAHGVKERRDGFNIAKVVNTRNACKYFSGLNQKSMTMYKVIWHFSDPDLIFPGMSCCFVYEVKDKGVMKLAGQIQSVFFRYAKEKKSISAIIWMLVQNPAFYDGQV